MFNSNLGAAQIASLNRRPGTHETAQNGQRRLALVFVDGVLSHKPF
jgi:hypothetical protein